MTSDGWRPIIGTINREPGDEVLLYKNPSQQDENSEPIKAQPIPIYTPPPTSSTKPYKTISTIQDVPAASTNNEISPTIRPQGLFKIKNLQTKFITVNFRWKNSSSCET